MDLSLLLEYGWVLLVLIALEGLLAADNALVLAIMVKHLPDEARKKALFYGLAGAFVFRFASLFLISFLVNVWQVQALGAIYLLFIAANHIFRKILVKKAEQTTVCDVNAEPPAPEQGSGFWMTVLKVELADIAFAVDSILAAVALAVALPETNLFKVGDLDGGHFIVIFLGGFTGLVIMRFAASFFCRLLQEKPGLEVAAFYIVGWVGVKLSVLTLSHPEVAVLSEHFPSNPIWKISFYVVLVGIAAAGWFLSKSEKPNKDSEAIA